MIYRETSKMQKMARIIETINDRIGTLNYRGDATYYSNNRVNELDNMRADLWDDLDYEKLALRDGGYW